jgi:hypothetical protein
MIYKVKPLQLIFFIIQALSSAGVLVFLIRAGFHDDKDIRLWIVLLLLLIIFMWSFIPFYLSITYIFEDWNKTVQFDEVNHVLLVTKRGNTTTIKRDEIIAAYQVMVYKYSGSRMSFPWFK